MIPIIPLRARRKIKPFCQSLLRSDDYFFQCPKCLLTLKTLQKHIASKVLADQELMAQATSMSIECFEGAIA
jgi:hypothetical protein